MIYNMLSLLESQALGALSQEHVRLSHNQELEAQERINNRLDRLKQRSHAEIVARKANRQRSLNEFIKVIELATPSALKVLSTLINASRLWKRVTLSAPRIGRMVGCNEKTVDRSTSYWRDNCLIFTKRRFNNSNITHLNPILHHPKLKAKLWPLIDAYKYVFQQASRYLSIWLLFTTNVPLENRDIYITKINVEIDNQLYKEVNTHSREVTINCTSVVVPDNSEQVEGVEMVDIQATPEEMRQDIRERRREVAASMSPLLHERVTKILHLTAKGQIRLMRYCDGAMLYGLECLNKHGLNETSINFRLFESACIEYSRNNDIKIESGANDSLLKELCYVESQACFKRLTLQSPLAQRVATPPAPNKAAYERKSRPKADRSTPYVDEPLPPSATKIIRAFERGHQEVDRQSHYKQMAMDPALNDVFIALALKLGHEHVIPLRDSVLNSVKNEDK